jgi:GT2 family glycosyltransferase
MLEGRDLSIIIINWNSANFLRRCLASVYANAEDLTFEVFVVDNASFDGCEEMLTKEFPDAKFIQSTENIGFARANNLAFKHSCGRNVLFLNPDTEIVGPAIQAMLSFLDSTAEAGIVGCKLLNSDLSIQTSCIQPFPSILNQVLDTKYLSPMFPRASLSGRRPLHENDDRPAVVEVISGACLMIRRNVFGKVGLFTPDYFMYAEDCDLCYKAKQAGWKAYYLGRTVVIHHGGRSSELKSESNFASVMMRQSLLRFMRERRGRVYAALYRVTMALVALCRLFLLGALMTFTGGRLWHQTMSRAFKKWAKVFGWAIGLKEWALAGK